MRWAFVYLRSWPFEKRTLFIEWLTQSKLCLLGPRAGAGERPNMSKQQPYHHDRGDEIYSIICVYIGHPTPSGRGKREAKITKRSEQILNSIYSFNPCRKTDPTKELGVMRVHSSGSWRATRKSNIRREKRCVAVWRWGRNEKKTARKRYDTRQGTSKLTDAGATFACLKRVTYTHSVCRFL